MVPGITLLLWVDFLRVDPLLCLVGLIDVAHWKICVTVHKCSRTINTTVILREMTTAVCFTSSQSNDQTILLLQDDRYPSCVL